MTTKEQLATDLWWEINEYWQHQTEDDLEELLLKAYEHGYKEAEYDCKSEENY